MRLEGTGIYKGNWGKVDVGGSWVHVHWGTSFTECASFLLPSLSAASHLLRIVAIHCLRHWYCALKQEHFHSDHLVPVTQSSINIFSHFSLCRKDQFLEHSEVTLTLWQWLHCTQKWAKKIIYRLRESSKNVSFLVQRQSLVLCGSQENFPDHFFMFLLEKKKRKNYLVKKYLVSGIVSSENYPAFIFIATKSVPGLKPLFLLQFMCLHCW